MEMQQPSPSPVLRKGHKHLGSPLPDVTQKLSPWPSLWQPKKMCERNLQGLGQAQMAWGLAGGCRAYDLTPVR